MWLGKCEKLCRREVVVGVGRLGMEGGEGRVALRLT